MSVDYLQKILTAKVYDVAVESPLEIAPNLSRRLGNRVHERRRADIEWQWLGHLSDDGFDGWGAHNHRGLQWRYELQPKHRHVVGRADNKQSAAD